MQREFFTPRRTRPSARSAAPERTKRKSLPPGDVTPEADPQAITGTAAARDRATVCTPSTTPDGSVIRYNGSTLTGSGGAVAENGSEITGA